MFKKNKPALNLRGVHFDLKGLPPLPKRLTELLDVVSAARFNCILMEWEDAYPWGSNPDFRCKTAYSKTTVKKFLKRASDLSIQIIPLVQSLGHLENVLSKKDFIHLRECPDNASEICPSNEESHKLIINMVDEILETHLDTVTHIHLGGDEAYMLGSCPKCKKIIQKHGKAYLYSQYMLPIIEHINKKGIRPILWDDMIRDWPLSSLKKLSGKVDLMAWSYAPKPFQYLKKETLRRYQKGDLKIWGASAFKGADGVTADLPNLKNRAENTFGWVTAAKELDLVGVIATGWSRYSTFCDPCESFESSLDSLIIAGAIMWDGMLSDNYIDSARSFLTSNKMSNVAGNSFIKCLKASQELGLWRKDVEKQINYCWIPFKNFSGESGRKNHSDEKKLRKMITDYLSQGKKYCFNWRRAHAKFIPKIWLEHYSRSRLSLVWQIGKIFLRDKSVS